MTVSQFIIFLVRYGLVILLFPASALDKIFNFKGAVGQASQVFNWRPGAAAMILVGVFVEIVMPLGILTGVADRFGLCHGGILRRHCGVVQALLGAWRFLEGR